MSVEDLAIDVGLVKDTDEFDAFVSCVTNILDLGCGYSEQTTKDIMEKCYTSELDIAKKVLRECRRAKTTSIRKSKLKWWQAYVPKRGFVEDREPSPVRHRSHERRQRRRSPERRSPERRPMDLTFKKSGRRPKERRQHRPMSPMFEKNPKRRRPMSPLFEQTKRPYQDEEVTYERSQPDYSRYRERPQYGRERERSQYERSDVPRWPGGNNKKRRRYR